MEQIFLYWHYIYYPILVDITGYYGNEIKILKFW